MEAKLTPEEKQEFYRSRFEEQRYLLRSAINAMGHGDIPQALHVAVAIRVLVHQTAKQKPLLKYLKSSFRELPIMERFEEPPKDLPPGVKAVTFFCPISSSFSEVDGKVAVSLITALDDPNYKKSTIGHWWSSPCMSLPGLGPVPRNYLILNLADKEGAHVDAKISDAYQKILGSQFMKFQMNNQDAALNISRMVVGKCGVELLDCLDKAFPT